MIEITLKQAFDIFKPSRFVFVISVDSNKKPSGMIAGQIMRCGSEPPLLAVSLAKSGYTHKLVKQSKEFVVAVPNESLREAVDYFSNNHGDEVDKFNEIKIETAKAKHVKTPLLAKATINFECKLHKEVDAGNHIIFIGKILAIHHNKGKGILIDKGRKYKNRYKEFKIGLA